MNPSDDGKTHINVYSKARTELGKFLSNFTFAPIETEDGHFLSVESYWYWLSCDHKDKDKLRRVYGWEAKALGRELGSKDWREDEQFKDKICRAIKQKIERDKIYKAKFKTSKLPFAHYYVFSTKVVEPKEGKWVIEYLETLRKEMQNGSGPRNREV